MTNAPPDARTSEVERLTEGERLLIAGFTKSERMREEVADIVLAILRRRASRPWVRKADVVATVTGVSTLHANKTLEVLDYDPPIAIAVVLVSGVEVVE